MRISLAVLGPRIAELGEAVKIQLALETGQARDFEVARSYLVQKGSFVMNVEGLSISNKRYDVHLVVPLTVKKELVELLWECETRSIGL